MDVNTPVRAWQQNCTTTIINRIVNHRNDYGEVHCKAWSAIKKRDLECFVAVLFVASVQKRKDKANCFSVNPLLENLIMKKMMTGRKFAMDLHCCPVENQDPRAEGYAPSTPAASVPGEAILHLVTPATSCKC
jgi:hypothetical protein